MKKSLSFSLVLLSALFLSACGVKDNNSFTTTPSLQQEETDSSSVSIRDLIAKNIPQKCTWSNNVEGSESSGSMIISGQKFNQKVTIKQDGVTSNFNSISDGTYIYTWQDTSKDGNHMAFKMKLETTNDNQKTPEGNYTASGQTVDLDQEYEYKCSPTLVSDSDFQPPKDIKFEDYSQFLEEIKSSVPSINPTNLE